MSWAAITEADVLTVMSAAELATIRATSLQGGQVDPLQPTIDDVTSLVRAYIGTASTLGATGTIPSGVKIPALDIIAYRLPMRVGGKGITEARQKAHDRAVSYLEDVSKLKIRFEDDSDARLTIVSSPDRQATRQTLAGMI
jgi:hypothetical protein